MCFQRPHSSLYENDLSGLKSSSWIARAVPADDHRAWGWIYRGSTMEQTARVFWCFSLLRSSTFHIAHKGFSSLTSVTCSNRTVQQQHLRRRSYLLLRDTHLTWERRWACQPNHCIRRRQRKEKKIGPKVGKREAILTCRGRDEVDSGGIGPPFLVILLVLSAIGSGGVGLALPS